VINGALLKLPLLMVRQRRGRCHPGDNRAPLRPVLGATGRDQRAVTLGARRGLLKHVVDGVDVVAVGVTLGENRGLC
jgi:hypothetical protein